VNGVLRTVVQSTIVMGAMFTAVLGFPTQARADDGDGVAVIVEISPRPDCTDGACVQPPQPDCPSGTCTESSQHARLAKTGEDYTTFVLTAAAVVLLGSGTLLLADGRYPRRRGIHCELRGGVQRH
jgi:hypothetical protein